MGNLIYWIYLRSPFFIKRIFANIEAVRRDYYRRLGGPRESLDKNENISLFKEGAFNLNKTKEFLKDVSHNVKYYEFLKDFNIKSAKDYSEIPILTKQIIKNNKEILKSKNITSNKELWKGSSSGSTGTPLKYFRDKNSVRINQSLNDAYYKYCGADLKKNKVRISGVKVSTYNRKKPPYWLFIDRYKQLQCSSYHISKQTYLDYLKAFEKYNADFATGFPSGWTALAELMLENGVRFDRFKAIVTDSEGLSLENQKKIEKAFNCKVYKTYGLGEVGLCAIECKNHNYHILPTHYVEVVDSNKETVKNGQVGEILVTDYNSLNYPFIRYATGDLGVFYSGNCECGEESPYLSEITGRIEDYILTKDGRKVTRLSLIMKPAVGIKESQIIQLSKEEIIIKVVRDKNFQSKSMEKVIEEARKYVGEMNISWESVKQLERMPSGKLKFLIRKF